MAKRDLLKTKENYNRKTSTSVRKRTSEYVKIGINVIGYFTSHEYYK